MDEEALRKEGKEVAQKIMDLMQFSMTDTTPEQVLFVNLLVLMRIITAVMDNTNEILALEMLNKYHSGVDVLLQMMADRASQPRDKRSHDY